MCLMAMMMIISPAPQAIMMIGHRVQPWVIFYFLSAAGEPVLVTSCYVFLSVPGFEACFMRQSNRSNGKKQRCVIASAASRNVPSA